MNKKTKFSVYDMAIVGVMAAIIFVITYFIKLPIATPAGNTMIKLANAFCLLAGILFGGVRGGLAAGLGSMLFDLLDPIYITSAPYTLVFFFVMAFVCGIISNLKRKEDGSLNLSFVILGSVVGALSYYVLNIGKSIIMKTVEAVGFAELFTATGGEAFQAAIAANVPKMITSSINVVIAVVIACIFAPILKKALTKAGLYNKISV
ncbi:ECF transporter S component [Paludicola sp. MB14-C6]|uniref:ECF transporter S component n=1 Tax=Paludihabitans sp. MB14-C6 TaxID=3070656 RepID=UPI0027DDBF14|nr:ECF transporter S component [Paludicola sp. MB14-C6]WMJ22409.1 ECF transporter S component [Paludicola sp. MB14-C6]